MSLVALLAGTVCSSALALRIEPVWDSYIRKPTQNTLQKQYFQNPTEEQLWQVRSSGVKQVFGVLAGIPKLTVLKSNKHMFLLFFTFTNFQ